MKDIHIRKYLYLVRVFPYFVAFCTSDISSSREKKTDEVNDLVPGRAYKNVYKSMFPSNYFVACDSIVS